MRSTTTMVNRPAQPAPIKTTIVQIVLLLAAFGTSGTMFAATLA